MENHTHLACYVWAWLYNMADSGHYSFRNEARQAAIKKRKQETDKEDETQEYFIAEFIQQKKHTDG